jgi:hypothetical protein
VAAVAAFAVGLGLSTGTASAGPFCYETGPGFEKCLTSPSGDYFNPIYQGPKLPDGYVPWSPPAPPAPVNLPVMPPQQATPSGPQVGAMCAHADMNSTAVAADGTAVRCMSVPSPGFEWLPDTGVQQTDPAIAGQTAWSDCIASHTAAECRQIVDGNGD